MGTSSSSKGSGSLSPLVPPWADMDGQGPGPEPPPQRFRPFRLALGKFVASGNQGHLRTALGHYARTATGGAATGARRFAPMAASGAALVRLISELQRGGTGEDTTGIDLSALVGRSVDVAIQETVRLLTPTNGDREKIAVALNQALSECLEGAETFEPEAITEEMLIDMLLGYIANAVFVEIVAQSNEAFQKTDDLERVTNAEAELMGLIEVVVDKMAASVISQRISNLSAKQLTSLQQQIVRDVLSDWGGYQ